MSTIYSLSSSLNGQDPYIFAVMAVYVVIFLTVVGFAIFSKDEG